MEKCGTRPPTHPTSTPTLSLTFVYTSNPALYHREKCFGFMIAALKQGLANVCQVLGQSA